MSIDIKTIEAYNAQAQAYDEETVGFWEKFPRTFLDQFISLSGEKVLDVGSGPGRDGLLLQQTGKKVVCMDAASAMVHLSRERGLDSVQASFEALPFSDGSFDAVWSYTALLHIPKSQFDEALREIHRVLTPGGFFALGLIEGDDEQYKESKKVSMPRLFSYYQKQDIEEKVKARGFEFVYFETFTPSTKNYLNFIFKKK